MDSCSYTEVPVTEFTIAQLKCHEQGADLGGEGKLGGFGFAGGVDGC